MLEEIKYAGENTIRAVIEETKNEFNKRLYVPASSESDDGKILRVVNGSAAWVDGAVESDYYYTSLSSAIADINNGVTTNSVNDINSAKVRVFYSETGRLTAQLLDDITESTQIIINKNVDLLLNGKVLSFDSASAFLDYGSDTSNCVIDGTVYGSEISKNITNSTTSTEIRMIKINGQHIRIIGGAYTCNTNAASNLILIAAYNDCEISNCTLSAIASNCSNYLRCIQILKCKTTVKDTSIHAESSTKTYAIVAFGGTLLCENVHITARTSASTCDGISTSAGYPAVMIIKNSTIVSDAPDCHIGSSNSVGINTVAESVCFIEDSYVFGTHSALMGHGDIYINGGTYTGYCHGGLYVAGNNAKKYVNDATLRCGNYEGIYDYSQKNSSIYACMYVGGGSNEGNSNIIVNLDGCTFGDGSTGGNAIVLRGTDGEQYNTVNISNSTITNGTSGIRIDNETHKLNVGVGCNITTDKIDHPEWAEFTNALYRMNHADKILTGDDYNAITSFYGITGTNNEVSWNELLDKPFGEVSGDTLTWDGNTDGLTAVANFVLISDKSFTLSDLTDGITITDSAGNVYSYAASDFNTIVDGVIVDSGFNIVSVSDIGAGVDANGIVFSEAGTYITTHFGGNYVTITVPGFTEYISVKKIDKKYIPSEANLYREGVLTEGDGSSYTATIEGITSLVEGLNFVLIPHTNSTKVNPTLNVNNLGPKGIRQRLSTSTTTTVAGHIDNWLVANKPIQVTFNGTYWVAELTRPDANTIYGTVPVANGGVPSAGSDNEGKFLQVVDGSPAWVDNASSAGNQTVIGVIDSHYYNFRLLNEERGATMAEIREAALSEDKDIVIRLDLDNWQGTLQYLGLVDLTDDGSTYQKVLLFSTIKMNNGIINTSDNVVSGDVVLEYWYTTLESGTIMPPTAFMNCQFAKINLAPGANHAGSFMRVNEDGLWDVEKVDVIQAPTTASVGQTLVVKTVDENGKPTEWETVDVVSNNDTTKLTLIDEATGLKYELTVVNGKLTMTEVDS